MIVHILLSPKKLMYVADGKWFLATPDRRHTLTGYWGVMQIHLANEQQLNLVSAGVLKAIRISRGINRRRPLCI